ncbi:uracil-DNA glycosylase [Patescibacteria group bacterium]|nr:uracil-DNA glycosylase [Patescibacteria group bacterium]
MEVNIEQSWKQALQDEFAKPYFRELAEFVRSEYKNKTVYPSPKNIFAAFNYCPLDEVKVVILGQDPYHGPKQAHGLCFSVPEGVQTPPSLINIYKEIQESLGGIHHKDGYLEGWAEQGVFLLNATLTVVAHRAGSHQKKGWETFTDAVVKTISDKREGVVFMLWGNYARSKRDLIDSKKHLILEAPHPSPLSANRGFFGCGHFKKANEYLKEPIKW